MFSGRQAACLKWFCANQFKETAHAPAQEPLKPSSRHHRREEGRLQLSCKAGNNPSCPVVCASAGGIVFYPLRGWVELVPLLLLKQLTTLYSNFVCTHIGVWLKASGSDSGASGRGLSAKSRCHAKTGHLGPKSRTLLPGREGLTSLLRIVGDSVARVLLVLLDPFRDRQP